MYGIPNVSKLSIEKCHFDIGNPVDSSENNNESEIDDLDARIEHEKDAIIHKLLLLYDLAEKEADKKEVVNNETFEDYTSDHDEINENLEENVTENNNYSNKDHQGPNHVQDHDQIDVHEQVYVQESCVHDIVDEQDHVLECSAANLFFVEKGILKTPPETNKILPGITRATVIKLAENDTSPVEICDCSVKRLKQADEVFITSTTKHILPVGRIDTKSIASIPGEVTKHLFHKWKQCVEQETSDPK